MVGHHFGQVQVECELDGIVRNCRDRCRTHGYAGIRGQGSQDEECVLGLDAVFLQLEFLAGVEFVPRQETGHIGGKIQPAGEQRSVELVVEVTMDVEFGALGIDQHASGVVVQVEGQVQAFVGDFFPAVALPRLL